MREKQKKVRILHIRDFSSENIDLENGVYLCHFMLPPKDYFALFIKMIIQTKQKHNIDIRIKVTPNQYERIVNKAYSKGYVSIAQFIRYIALDRDMTFENKFNDMYRILKRLETKLEKIEDKIYRDKEGLLI